jgi:outer membrane beta-barrel protein
MAWRNPRPPRGRPLSRKVACVLLAASCMVCTVCTTARADDGESDLNGPHVLREKMVELIHDENNVVRSGPGNDFSIVAVLPMGSRHKVIAKSGDWYDIRLSDTETGWIHASLCREYDDMSSLEFRPNPRLFSRVGSFSLTAYTGAYAFDRKSNSLVVGGRLGYYVFDHLEVEGSLGWSHITRPAEIVESLFELSLAEEDFHMLFYQMNLDLKLLPGRQMVPFVTAGLGSTVMQGETESSFNYGAGTNLFVSKRMAMRFEFRAYQFRSGFGEARRTNNNVEFTVGTSLLF